MIVYPFSTASTVDMQGVFLSIIFTLQGVSRVYPSTASSVWTCKMYPLSTVCSVNLHPQQFRHVYFIQLSAVWPCRVYPSKVPLVWMCRVYSSPPPAVYCRCAGCIPYTCLLCGRAECINLRRKQYGFAGCILSLYLFPFATIFWPNHCTKFCDIKILFCPISYIEKF